MQESKGVGVKIIVISGCTPNQLNKLNTARSCYNSCKHHNISFIHFIKLNLCKMIGYMLRTKVPESQSGISPISSSLKFETSVCSDLNSKSNPMSYDEPFILAMQIIAK